MKRFMIIVGASLIAALVSLLFIRLYLDSENIDISIHGQIAITIGIFFSLIVGFGLMTLLFMSNKHGHDQVVYDLNKEDDLDDSDSKHGKE